MRPAPGSNYRLPEHGLSFLVGNHDETEAGFITALHLSDVSAEAITAPPEPDSAEEQSKLDEARDFVRVSWGGAGAGQGRRSGGQGGPFEERTLQRARAKEGVKCVQRGTVGAPDWWWEHAGLPSRQPAEEGDPGEMGTTLFDQGFSGDENDAPLPSAMARWGGWATWRPLSTTMRRRCRSGPESRQAEHRLGG